MALQVYAITLFVSAFLLFLVQPLIGKMILPKLGGTPQVWNTCMLFYQMALLLGYTCTHFITTRLKLRQQLIAQGVMLALPLLVLVLVGPFNVTGFVPPTDTNPIPATLILLATVVGVPFFVVSMTSPLLQRWFSHTGHPAAKDPYFLSIASNVGSFLALLAYPAIVEPLFPLATQAHIWWGMFVLLAGLILYCASMLWQVSANEATVPDTGVEAPPTTEAGVPAPPVLPVEQQSTAVKPGHAPTTGKLNPRRKGQKPAAAGRAEAPVERVPEISSMDKPVTLWRRLRWVLLAAVPSSLMLGVTSYISVDLSPFPLLWVIPLALYLLSFILVFMPMWTGTRIKSNLAIFGSDGLTPHDIVAYAFQPISILALCYLYIQGGFNPTWSTLIAMVGFFFTALLCHGEMAKDRPDAKHLTEFYLLMSVGGMVGGLFNGIFAPIMFPGVWEYPIAMVAACLMRPVLSANGWFDRLLISSFPQLESKDSDSASSGSAFGFSLVIDVFLGLFILALAYVLRERATPQLMFDILKNFVRDASAEAYWPAARNLVIYGIPLVFCFFFSPRPIRFGLSVAALMLANLYFGAQDSRSTLDASRSYFGVLRVQKDSDYIRMEDGEPLAVEARFRRTEKIDFEVDYTFLMHGTTYHGRAYTAPTGNEKFPDLSRLATTYYHRYGPIGFAMEPLNWFPGPQNTFWADARMPAAIVTSPLAALGISTLPTAALVNLWSEPPFATIGLGSGTMASYARPYQHLTYYEIDEKIRNYSMPPGERLPYFPYLKSAVKRGATVEIIMGDARLSMFREDPKNSFLYFFRNDEAKLTEPIRDTLITQPREKFYRVIVVDAFSSDAIPIHLLTKQAIELYLSKMSDNGTLCVHTSNRHMDLVKPTAKIVEELRKEPGYANLRCIVGKDPGGRGGNQKTTFVGHFSSEYVMLYREPEKTEQVPVIGPDGKATNEKRTVPESFLAYTQRVRAEKNAGGAIRRPMSNSTVEWYNPLTTTPPQISSSLWTDDFSNIISIIR